MEQGIEEENRTVKSVMGWKGFHLLYLLCISSAFSSKLRMGEATLDNAAFLLPSVSLEYALWCQ